MDPLSVISFIPQLLPAYGVTLQITVLSIGFALVFGIPLGTLRSCIGRRRPLAWAIDAWVAFVRGTPLIVQIFAAYFILPEMGVRASPFWIGVLALAFNSAGYQIEIARAAVGSLHPGQMEGALSLGLTRLQAFALVLLPQAGRRMMPAMLNETSQILKASSVLSVLAVFELHKAADSIMANNFRFLDLLAAQAIFYLATVIVLERCAAIVARRLSVGSTEMAMTVR